MSAAADPLLVVHEASVMADQILGDTLRLPVTKALDLGTASGFDRAVALLAAKLRQRARQAEVDAVREAVAVLDVDWRRTTPEERGRLVAQALAAAGRAAATIPARIQAPLGEAAEAVVAATRSHARRGQGLAIGASFNALDRRIIEHLRKSQANYVRDAYGQRHDAFSEKARRIVADGLEAGLGRDDIARDLERAARAALIERSVFYWEVVAAAFVGRGRAFAQLSAYAEASITRYRIVAVLDEVTTPVCRFLDGKTFSVSHGLALFEQVEAHPHRIEQLTPWVREQIDPKTKERSLYIERGGERTVVAAVTRSGVGTRDDRGAFVQAVGDHELGELGLGPPPYHGLCRSHVVPVVT